MILGQSAFDPPLAIDSAFYIRLKCIDLFVPAPFSAPPCCWARFCS